MVVVIVTMVAAAGLIHELMTVVVVNLVWASAGSKSNSCFNLITMIVVRVVN